MQLKWIFYDMKQHEENIPDALLSFLQQIIL